MTFAVVTLIVAPNKERLKKERERNPPAYVLNKLP